MNRKSSKRRCALVSSALALTPIISPWSAFAQTVPVGGRPGMRPAMVATGSSSLHPALDLGSTNASLSSPNNSAVSINIGGSLSNGTVIGGTQLSISPGQSVTPAQYAAVYQLIHGGNQALVVNSMGAAQSGSLNLSSKYLDSLANLVIPGGVSVTASGYNSKTPLNVSGALDISGSMHAIQGAANITSVLNLGSLTINQGGLLSGYLPSGSTQGYASGGMNLNVSGSVLNRGTITSPGALNILAGGNVINQSVNSVQSVMSAQNLNIVSNNGSIINSGLIQAVNTFNLAASSNTLPQSSGLSASLRAAADINNSGTISSGGSLSLHAGGAVINALMHDDTVAVSSLLAADNIGIVSGSGNVTNAGLISSANGDVNISSASKTQDINLNGFAGSIQAYNGSINLRDASYAGSANINVVGGDYLSRDVNLYSGSGTVTVNVGQLTGNLNTIAGTEHVFADTDLLKLGNHCVSGDPTYYNTGSIQIVDTVSAAEDLAIIAGANITADANGQIVTNGNNLILISGANILSACSGCTTPGPGKLGPSAGSSTPSSGLGIGAVDVSLSGGNGGNIDLSSSTAATVIDTSSSSGAGGNVTMVALADGSGAQGKVLLNSGSNLGTINTSGALEGGGGNVTIFAGADPAVASNSITTNKIVTISTGALSSGNVTLATTQAVTSDGQKLVFDASGHIASGNSIQAGSTLAKSGITTGDIDTHVNGGAAAAGNVNIKAYGDIFTSAGTIATINDGVGPSGEVNISSSKGAISTGEIDTFVYGGWLPAANVTISAYGDISTNGKFIYAFQGGSGVGGTIRLTSINGSVSTGMLLTGVGDSTAAGNVIISALGNINTDKIYAFNAGTGGGGSVSLSSSNGAVTTGEIFTNVNLGVYAAGAVTISAQDTITVSGTINASNGGTGSGGTVSLLSSGAIIVGDINTSSTGLRGGSVRLASAGNDSLFSISAGKINTSATTAAGSVEIVSIDPAFNLTLVGDITTQATGSDGVGGSVGIASLGLVQLGNVDTNNTSKIANPGAQGGSVFISSGVSSIDAKHISVYNPSNGSASGQAILISPGLINTFSITTEPGELGFYPLYSPSTTSINSSMTIDTSVSGIAGVSSNYNPQGYTSISGVGTQLTINSGGNSSLLVPLLALGAVSIDSIKSNSGTNADGISLVALGDITLNGSNSLSSAGSVSGGNASLLSVTGQITANALVTSSSGVASSGALSLLAKGAISVGNLNTSNSSTGAGGAVSLVSGYGAVSSGKIDSFSTAGSNLAGDVSIAAYGSITTGGGSIATYNTGKGAGGAVMLTSATDSVSTGGISTYASGAASAGSINIAAYGDVDTQAKSLSAFNNGTGRGGAVLLASSTGSVSSGSIETYVDGGAQAAGDVTISAYLNIDTNKLSIDAHNNGTGTGSAVNILSSTGKVTTGSINVSVSQSSLAGGNVNIEAFDVIDTSAGTITANNGGARPLDAGVTLTSSSSSVTVGSIDISVTGGAAIAGDVIISAEGSIKANSKIDASNLGTGDAGKINIESINGLVSLDQIDSSVNSASASGGVVSVSAHGSITAAGTINTSNAGSGLAGGGSAGELILISGTDDVTTAGINSSVGGNSALSGSVTILADKSITVGGAINSSNSGSGAGGTVALTAGKGSVQLNDVVVSSAGFMAGNILVTAPGAVSSGKLDTSNTGTGLAGSVAIVSADKISTGKITSTGTPSGSVFLSSAFSGSGAIVTGAISAETLLATAATSGSVTVQPFSSGQSLSVDGGDIHASGKYSDPIVIFPLNFDIQIKATLTPASIPGGGFASFSNTGTLTLANDSGSSGSVISFANLLPVFVQGSVSSFGKINDSIGNANFFVVSPTVSVTSATSYSSSRGSLSILANQMNLADVHTSGVNLQLTAVQDMNTGSVNTINSLGTLSGNVSLLSVTGSVNTNAIQMFVSSGAASAGNLVVSAYGNFNTNKQIINVSNAGTGAGGAVNIVTTGTGSVETGLINTSVTNSASRAPAGNLTVLAAAAIDTNLQKIDTSNSGSGAGGTVNLTSNTFSVNTGEINTHVDSGSLSAGNVILTAYEFINTGDINAYHGAAGSGGSVTLMRAAAMTTGNVNTSSVGYVGGAITAGSAGDNGIYSLAMGNLNTSGSLAGGAVLVVSDDFGEKPLLVGTITTSASSASGIGGAVGIAALGALAVGNINTTNTALSASGAAQSGSVFLSSGLANTNSISAGSINAYNANGSSSGQVILVASGTITTFGSITTSAGVILPQVFTSNALSGTQASVTPNYSSDKISISSSTTVDVSVTGISNASSNFNPQGYAALSGADTELTVNTGGNSSLLAPLIFTAYVPMSIKSIKAANSSAADAISLLVFGNLTLSDGIQAAGTVSGGNVSVVSSAGQISANKIDTHSDGSGAAGSVNIAALLGVPVSGAISSYNKGTGAGGAVSLISTNNSVSTGNIETYALNSSAGAGNIVLSSYGALSTGDLNTSNGGTGSGGSVFLTSSNSSVSTGAIDTRVSGASASAGYLLISAHGDIDTGKVQTYNSVGTGVGGSVGLFSTAQNSFVTTGDIATFLSLGSAAVGNVTVSSLGAIVVAGNISGGIVNLNAGEKISVNAGATVTNTTGDLLIETTELDNDGAIDSSGKIWVFTQPGADLTISGTGTMSASATAFGLSPVGGGTVTNRNLFVTGNQSITGELGIFSSASGTSGVISLSTGSSLSSSTGINIDTPTLLNSGTLTASGTITVPGVTPNPGPVGIFAQNQRASAGITIDGTGGVWNALAGGTYIQALYPNGIVLTGDQTFNGPLTLNDLSNDGFVVGAGSTISLSSPTTINAPRAVINGTVNFNAGGTINSVGDITGSGLITAAAGILTLHTSGGNIGSSVTPLAVSSGASGVKNLYLDVIATAGTPNNGNVWLIDNDSDPAPVGNPAVFLNAVSGSNEGLSSSGNFSFTATAGSIGIHPTQVIASSSVTLVAQRSIIQKHGESITAPVINMTAVAGNIGLSETSPTIVSSGSSSKTQLQLTVNATANTNGNGNIWISDADQDVVWGVPVPALALKSAAAGSGTPIDATTGNIQITTIAGGISVAGATKASNVISFNSNSSILQTGVGSLAAPSINLKSNIGNIGSSSTPLSVSSGNSGSKQLNLSAIAAANTIGNGNVWLTDSDLDVGPLSPAVLLYGVAGNGSSPAVDSGTFSMTNTGGSIGIHPTTLTASKQIVLTAQENVVQLHGEVISAPVISLTATKGNIGLDTIPFIVSSGASGSTQLQLTMSAPNNASGRGNIFVTDADSDLLSGAAAVMLGSVTAGSGSPVDGTTGRVVFSTSAGSIAFNGTSIATSSITFNANANIVQASGGSLSSPAMAFTATTGNIGSSPVPVSTNASVLSANAFANVYLKASSASLTLNASSGNTFVLSTTANNGVATINGINANNVILQAQGAINSGFVLDGTIGGQLSTNAVSVVIAAAGSGDISNPNSKGSINTGSLVLSSGTGTIGLNLTPIITTAAVVTANTGASGAQQGVFITDNNPNSVSIQTSSSGSWFDVIAYNDITVDGSISAGSASGNGSLVLLPNGNITLNASLISNNPNTTVNGIVIQTPTFGTITQTKGTINTAGSVVVIDGGFGDIGSAAHPISVSAATPQVLLNFATAGNAYVSSPNSMRVFDAIGNDIEITAVNSVTIAGLTTVNNLTVRTLNGGNVVFDGGSLALFAGGNASSCTVNVNGKATISTINNFTLTANSLNLVSQNGYIGSSAQPIETTAAAISVSSLGKVYINDSNTKVSLGSISASDFKLTSNNISALQSINVGGVLTLIANSGNLTYSGSTSNVLDLRAPAGTINLPSAQLSVIPNSTSGAGGTINVVAANLVYPGSSSFSPLQVSAQGVGTGDGGSISIQFNSQKALMIGSGVSGKNPPPTQVMALDARSGLVAGNGGIVSVTTGGDLTVAPDYLSTAPSSGNGANITLIAGKNLLVNGPLNANAAVSGNGGNITLASNSSTVFSIGASGTTFKNAILKSTTSAATPVLSVNGTAGKLNGAIAITNAGGSLTNLVPLTAVQTLSLTAGAAGSVLVKNPLGGSTTSSITLSATGSGSVSSSTPSIKTATLNLNSATGSIGSSTAPLQFDAVATNASAPAANGIVNLTNQATGNISMGASAAGKSFKLTAPKAANVSTTGAISSPSVLLSAPAGAIGQSSSHFQVNSPAVTISAKGLVFADNLSTASSTLNKSSGQSFTFVASGNLTVNGISTTNGAISVQTSSGVLQTAPSAVITTKNGTISLVNTDNSTTGSVILGKASKLTTNGPTGGLFPVTIKVGTGGTLSTTNPLPSSIKVVKTTGGQAFFSVAGTPGLSAVLPVNTINLKGSDVILDSGANGSIRLNGQVVLTADPVPPAVASLGSVTITKALNANSSSALKVTPVSSASTAAPSDGLMSMVFSSQLTNGFGKTSSAQAALSWMGAQAAIQNGSRDLAVLSNSKQLHFSTDSATSFEVSEESPNVKHPLLFSDETNGNVLKGYLSTQPEGLSTEPSLRSGAGFFVPSKNLVVKTAFGKIKIDAGSAVLLMAFADGIAVYDLHDSHRNGVSISAAGHEISLSPGYRDVRELEFGNGLKAISSEFSIERAVALLFMVNKLEKDENQLQNAKTRKILANILKNAAIMHQLHSNKGRFEQFKRQSTTAFAPQR